MASFAINCTAGAASALLRSSFACLGRHVSRSRNHEAVAGHWLALMCDFVSASRPTLLGRAGHRAPADQVSCMAGRYRAQLLSLFRVLADRPRKRADLGGRTLKNSSRFCEIFRARADASGVRFVSASLCAGSEVSLRIWGFDKFIPSSGFAVNQPKDTRVASTGPASVLSIRSRS